MFSADDGVLGLGKRALGARDSSGTDSGSSFVDNKCAFSNFYFSSYGTGLMQNQLFSISYNCVCWALSCTRVWNHAQCVVLPRYIALAS